MLTQIKWWEFTYLLIQFKLKILNDQNLVEISVTNIYDLWIIPNALQFHWMRCQRFEKMHWQCFEMVLQRI